MFGLLLCAPLIQRWSGLVREFPLAGVEAPAQGVPFSGKAFLSGEWQRGFEETFTHELGFRTHLVRTDNQLSLSVFHEVKPPRLLGDGDYLQDADYHPRNGVQLEPLENLFPLVSSLYELNRELDKRGVALMVILSPAKPRVLPDHLPKAWQRYPRTPTEPLTADLVTTTLTNLGVPAFDFGPWFASRRATAQAPLFTKGGVHWSVYGAALAGSELLRCLAALTKKPFPELAVTGIRSVDEPPESDADLANLVNVWDTRRFWSPPTEPVLERRMPENGTRARILFVGTSYVWNLTSFLMKHDTCSFLEVWYYAKTRVRLVGPPGTNLEERPPLDLEKLDFDAEFRRFDAVVLEAPGPNANQIAFELPLAAFRALTGLRGK